eukprot:TRINITY_DN10657_c0_g1_i4.p1 TRINITY_DN10657_c0_g1~~TRINITY_DN10657_c0_g1_i4.p1  ORF type:complete len:154 (-),score=12.90 TRINITY_DN10657_c0_g1_i4:1121-1582(-)
MHSVGSIKDWWTNGSLITKCSILLCTIIYLASFLVLKLESWCLKPSLLSEVYRIFTSPLFHASFIHLFFNMLVLQDLGNKTERFYGSISYLLLTATIGCLGSIFDVIIQWVQFFVQGRSLSTCTVGYSGILFGLLVISCQINTAPVRCIWSLG